MSHLMIEVLAMLAVAVPVLAVIYQHADDVVDRLMDVYS
jgi:hypothetical protein